MKLQLLALVLVAVASVGALGCDNLVEPEPDAGAAADDDTTADDEVVDDDGDDDTTPEERCAARSEDDCDADEECAPVEARPIAIEAACAHSRRYAGCYPADRGCDDVMTPALDEDGGCWLFNDSCVPADFTPLEQSSDSDDACVLATRGELDDCP